MAELQITTTTTTINNEYTIREKPVITTIIFILAIIAFFAIPGAFGVVVGIILLLIWLVRVTGMASSSLFSAGFDITDFFD